MQPRRPYRLSAGIGCAATLFALCLMASLMSGCAKPTNVSAPYSPVLLSAYERACLTRETLNVIQLNNELWLEGNE